MDLLFEASLPAKQDSSDSSSEKWLVHPFWVFRILQQWTSGKFPEDYLNRSPLGIKPACRSIDSRHGIRWIFGKSMSLPQNMMISILLYILWQIVGAFLDFFGMYPVVSPTSSILFPSNMCVCTETACGYSRKNLASVHVFTWRTMV